MDSTALVHSLRRYAELLHARAGDNHHVVSPLGAWMVVALSSSAAISDRDKEAFARVLGADPGEAFRSATALLSDIHPLVAAASGLWVRRSIETAQFKSWQNSLPPVVDTGDVPTQAELDAWTAERTFGLINHFPLTVTPTVVCLLASALATKVSWEVPFEVVDAAEIEPSDWSTRLRWVLRAPGGDPRHRQFLVTTERAGTVCVHLAQARGGLLVGSVIAADERTTPADVLATAEEIVTAEAGLPRSARRLSLFDLPLGDGPVWSLVEEHAVNVDAPGGRDESVISTLPAWQAKTTLPLTGDESLGFDYAARIVASVFKLRQWKYEASQACVARYSAVGFEAAAVTGLKVNRSLRPPGVRRIATVRFAHPFAVVAATFDDKRLSPRADSPSQWHGLPVFSAWVANPCDAQ